MPPLPDPTEPPLAPLPMMLFALAALSPLPVFAAGLWLGGGCALAGALYMTALVAGLDRIATRFGGNAPEGAEFPAADALLVAIGLAALAVMALASHALAGPGLSTIAKVPVFLACGFWLGQVAHPAAHELIHRGNRWLFRLGVAVYTALLFGHHASAHRLVHHRHVASANDPNSARAGEGFYRFALRAWIGSFRAGWRAESALRGRGAVGNGLHPYAVYIGGAALALGFGWWLGGARGMAIWAGLGAFAQMQLLVSDYVQHYGLTRARLPDGRLEPVGPAHSWNAPHWFSSAMMLNAPRHSDHHAHPSRPYPALRLGPVTEVPMLPWPLPMACTIAFLPPLWRRAIRPHLARWKAAPPRTDA